MSHILYKYLDINGGKLMMGIFETKCVFGKKTLHPTLQFTNASQLNDPFDCHPNLVDYSDIPDAMTYGWIHKKWLEEKGKNDALNLRNDTWLCSLSKINDSLLMWSHYCRNHSGICIGLNMEKVMDCVPPLFGTFFLKPLVFEVQYQDIINRPDAYRTKEDLFRYQWSTKAKEWAYEQEVRLVVKEPSAIYAAYTPEQAKMKKKEWDWREIHHYMPLKGECFEEIYFGVKIDDKEKLKIINFARTKLNPEIKLYKMNIDESAFRLKAKAVD